MMENNKITIEKFYNDWKSKKFPPVKRDKKWRTLKWHICKKGEQVNPILFSSGGEIEVEIFGIVGYLWKIKNKDTGEYFYQCPLIEARETGTGKFGEWLKTVKEFVEKKYKAKFVLTSITNQRLYKYCEKCNIEIAVDGRLYKVKIKHR